MAEMRRKLTIGELARRTGISVKKLRFYSDEGLLPPAGRSPSGYRLYAEDQVHRIELIRLLREAGVGLTEIAKLLRRDVTLERVLALQLEAVEAHIASLRRVASALRLAIRSGATEDQLRRVTMITRTSREERKKLVTEFYDKVNEGLPAPRAWVDDMVDASLPELADPPSAEQLEAWIELEKLMADPALVAVKRASSKDFWTPLCDPSVLVDTTVETMIAVNRAREQGTAPSSGAGAEIVARFTSALARAAGCDEREVRAHVRTKFDPRGARFWELVAVIRQQPLTATGRYDDWRWLGEALQHHAPEA